MMDAFFSDVRFGIRRLRKSPGFTAIVVASLALGIGPNLAIFALTSAVLLRPVSGVADPGRLVWVLGQESHGPLFVSASYPDYLDYAERSRSLAGVVAFDNVTLKLRHGAKTEVIHGQAVSPNFFSVLGVRPAVGGTFAAKDLRGDAEPVVVLGHRFWTRWLGADPSVVGASVSLNDVQCTVAGVASRDFTGPEAGLPPDVWFPAGLLRRLTPDEQGGPGPLAERGVRRFQLWGRLGPAASLDQARAEMDTLGRQLASENPGSNKDVTATVQPVSGGVNPLERGDMLGFAVLMMALMSLVLLIACANVANLISIRAVRRQKELGMQHALGATPGRLMRQVLLETLLLFLAGGALAVLLGQWTARALLVYAPTDRPLVLDSLVDLRVLAFALGVSLITGLAVGLVAVMRTLRRDLAGSLKADAATGGLRGARARLGGAFVIGQVTLSVVLLVCAGLFVRTLQNARSIDPGFAAKNLLTVPLDLKLQGYPEARGKEFLRTALDRLRGRPGVAAASLARTVPLGLASGETKFVLEGRNEDDLEHPPYAGLNIVEARYFETLGIGLQSGRSFGDRDVTGAPGVAVVNETMARRFWPGASPLGHRLRVEGGEESFLEIVGVVKDSKYGSLGESPQPYIYLPLAQNYVPDVNLLVRAGGDTAGTAGVLRSELLALDPNLSPLEIGTMDQQVSRSLSPVRAATHLVGGMGVLALVLAAVGVFGLLAYTVSRRTREIGIRMALGARPQEVLALVLRQGLRLVLVGEALGLVLALVLTRFMSGFVFGVSPADPVTYLGSALLLAAVGVLAGYLPAMRAARIDPYTALRQE